MSPLLWFISIVVFVIMLAVTLGGNPARWLKETITDETQLLIDSIVDNPGQWRTHNTSYFYNAEKGYVFWIHCNRSQFKCVAGGHLETANYQVFPASQGQLNHIYAAYLNWLNVFNEMNLKETMPSIEIRRN